MVFICWILFPFLLSSQDAIINNIQFGMDNPPPRIIIVKIISTGSCQTGETGGSIGSIKRKNRGVRIALVNQTLVAKKK